MYLPVAGLLLLAGNGKGDTYRSGKGPSLMQPPSQALPDTTRLVNDSVTVPAAAAMEGRLETTALR